ncbi:MAG TPA: hypothetical protein ENN05_09385 [Deltaproteobacteria bacterium]|nr:hypothetical protein [Deltaproteobacteria bacterium]
MRRTVIAILSVVFIAFSLAVIGLAQDHSAEEVFYRANQAYKQGDFTQAAQAYGQLIEMGYANGHLYYNLGNSFFRSGQEGKAILMYERAYLLMPRDADLLFNMNYVKDQRVDALQEGQGVLASTFFWLNSLNLAEFYRVFVICNLLLFTALILRLFMNPSWMPPLIITAAFVWSAVAGSVAMKWYQVNFDDRAVVLEKEMDVLSGPQEGDTVLFRLHEGTIVYEERTEDQWVLIQLSADKRGWVRAESIEGVRM